MSCTACDGSQTLRVTRGESRTFLLTITNQSTKLSIDVTGAKVWFTIKNRVEDVNAIVAKKNSIAGGVDGQILITVPQTGITIGQVQVFLDPADTAGLDPEETYWCDAWVQLTTGKRYQVVSNRAFRVDPAVTSGADFF